MQSIEFAWFVGSQGQVFGAESLDSLTPIQNAKYPFLFTNQKAAQEFADSLGLEYVGLMHTSETMHLQSLLAVLDPETYQCIQYNGKDAAHVKLDVEDSFLRQVGANLYKMKKQAESFRLPDESAK